MYTICLSVKHYSFASSMHMEASWSLNGCYGVVTLTGWLADTRYSCTATPQANNLTGHITFRDIQQSFNRIHSVNIPDTVFNQMFSKGVVHHILACTFGATHWNGTLPWKCHSVCSCPWCLQRWDIHTSPFSCLVVADEHRGVAKVKRVLEWQ